MSDRIQIIKAAARLRQQAKEANEQADMLLDSLGDLAVDDYVAGPYILQVRPTVRFDPATAERNLTAEEFALTLATKPDSAMAKKVLSPERYAAAQRVYGVTRRIIEVTDG